MSCFILGQIIMWIGFALLVAALIGFVWDIYKPDKVAPQWKPADDAPSKGPWDTPDGSQPASGYECIRQMRASGRRLVEAGRWMNPTATEIELLRMDLEDMRRENRK